MIEMLKSKTIILFIVMVLGISLIASPTTKLENNETLNEDYVTYNMK